MRSDALRLALLIAATSLIAPWGADEARAVPVQLDRVAEDTQAPTARAKVMPRYPVRRSVRAGQGIAVHELLNHADPHADPAMSKGLVRLRPSRRTVSTEKLLADVGALDATPDGRPISDVYDFAGSSSGEPAPIRPRPRQMARHVKPPETGDRYRQPDTSWAATAQEPRQWRRPEPPDPKPERPVNTGDALDLGIKTLDYVVTATRIIVEMVSRLIMEGG